MTNKTMFLFSALAAFCLFFLSYYIFPEAGINDGTILTVFLKTTREQWLMYGRGFKPMLHSGISEWLIIILPLLVSAPFLYPLEESLQGGFYRFQVSRKGYRRFICLAHIQNMLIGAAAVFTGYLAFAVTLYLRFPRYSEMIEDETGLPKAVMNLTLQTDSELIQVLVRFAVFFFFAMVVAAFCMLCMVVTMNKFKAIGTPMILLYLLDRISVILYMRSVERDSRLYLLSPSKLMGSAENWWYNCEMSFIWYFLGCLGLIVLMSLISSFIMKRRVTG